MAVDDEPTLDERVQAWGLLAHAAKLIEARSGWTQGELARNRFGHRVRIDSPSASRYCALGAIVRAEVELYGSEITTTRADDRPVQQVMKGSPRLLVALQTFVQAALLVAERDGLLAAEEPLSVEIPFSEGAGGVFDGLVAAAMHLNDLRGIGHRRVLRAMVAALAVAAVQAEALRIEDA